MLDRARQYLSAGLCVLPAVVSEKRPAIRGRWEPYQTRLPTEAETCAWFSNGHTGLCLICGVVSGHLEMIDFDASAEKFAPWCQQVESDAPGLLARLLIETTPSGGRHVIYRCPSGINGNLKLAERKHLVRPDEIVLDGAGKKTVRLGGKVYAVRTDAEGQDYVMITLIETRGEGGLFLCDPSPGYQLVQGRMDDVPIVTADQREILLAAAWTQNEYWPQPEPQPTAAPASAGLRPGDDYAQRGDVRALLIKHGWTLVRSGDNEHWRRPGKTSGWSATLRDRVFYVFSSSAAPFEPNTPYGPFAVYAHLEHGGDFAAAARELRGQGFGGPADVHNGGDDVDISGIVDGAEPAEPSEPQIPDPGQMPLEMLRIPGFVSEVMDHCLAIAPYPNPVMAFAGAISLMAFLAGRKVRDPGDNRTNFYLLGLAHSSAGKDWPRKVNTRIIHEIGLAECLGEHFSSGEGIQDALFQTPGMLFQTDEIDGLLQSINKSKDARHEAIMSTLLTMYSSANSVFPMRRKAGKEAPGVIDQPNLVIFGTAIPNHYYEALSERMLTNGFFARMIILESGPRPEGQEPSIREVPPSILATAKWWADFRPGTGNLEDFHPVPAVVEHSDEAKQLLIETRRQAEAEYSAAEGRSDSVGTTVWGRVSEQTRKLALLYAVSENHQSPRISLAAVQWASTFVMHQTRRMLFMAAGHVAEGEFDALIKRAVAILRHWREKNGADSLMPAWELRRRLKQRPSDFKDVVFELTERRIAVFDTERAVTKPKSGYRLL